MGDNKENRRTITFDLDEEQYEIILKFASDNGANLQQYMRWLVNWMVFQRNGRLGQYKEIEYWNTLRSYLDGVRLRAYDMKRTEWFRVVATDDVRTIDMYIDGIEGDPKTIAKFINGLFEHDNPSMYIGTEVAGVNIIDIEDIKDIE